MLRIVLSAVAVAGVIAALKPVLIDPFASAAVENAKAAASAIEQIASAAPALSSTVRVPASDHSLEDCISAQAVGMTGVLAGVYTAREEADRQLLARGFRPFRQRGDDLSAERAQI
jgi:hypothetical protein